MRDPKFDAAFAYTVSKEGGFVDDKIDRGGATKFGITLRTLSRWRAPRPVVADDVRNLDLDESKDIYFAWYWCPAGCDRIDNNPIAMAIFDMAVLMGAHTAVLYSQMTLNQIFQGVLPMVITADGKMGPNTVSALIKAGPRVFLPSYRDLLLKRCADIVNRHPEQSRFINGWNNRIEALVQLEAFDGEQRATKAVS